jgi:hypothetical protein
MGIAIVVKGVNFSKSNIGEVTKKNNICIPECPCQTKELSKKKSTDSSKK